MGCLGHGPERSFQSLYPCRSVQGKVRWSSLLAGHHDDSISWGFHQHPCSPEKHPAFLFAGPAHPCSPLPPTPSALATQCLKWGGGSLCCPGQEMRAGLSRREMEAQEDPEGGGRPSWREVGKYVHRFACLKAGAGPGTHSSGSCRPPWTPAPQPIAYRLGGSPPRPHHLWQQGVWCQQNIVPGERQGQSSQYLDFGAHGLVEYACCALPACCGYSQVPDGPKSAYRIKYPQAEDSPANFYCHDLGPGGFSPR